MRTRDENFLRYDQTRTSSFLVGVLGLGTIAGLTIVVLAPDQTLFWYVTIVCFFLLVNFYNQRVAVDNHSIFIRYGVGLVTIAFELRDIASVRTVANNAFSSRLFCPGFTEAVCIEKQDGKKITLPFDNARFMVDLLRSRSEMG